MLRFEDAQRMLGACFSSRLFVVATGGGAMVPEVEYMGTKGHNSERYKDAESQSQYIKLDDELDKRK